MRLLLVGGSGVVGTMVIPYLKEGNALRVLDLVPPRDTSVEFIEGSVNDPAAVGAALEGMEGVVYLALGRRADGSRAIDDLDSCYDLSVKGLHRVLLAMSEAGLRRAVYASTVSVHGTRPTDRPLTEDMPADAASLYGFTKWLGELVCSYFARVHGMAIAALRLHNPLPRDQWLRACRPGQPNLSVAAPDAARAIVLGLTVPFSGFHALLISGDYEGRSLCCSRAKQVLGWRPLERPSETPATNSGKETKR